jgi:hypothetical protein
MEEVTKTMGLIVTRGAAITLTARTTLPVTGETQGTDLN